MSKAAPENTALPINDRREIFGWTMYDWAGSAFSTTVGGVLLAPYVTSLAQNAVGDNGVIFSLGFLGDVTAKSLWPYTTSVSVLLQVFFLPILGAVADYTNLKKRILFLFTYIAVVATCLLFFITNGLYLLGALLFIIANVSFGGAIVMYNAYLPEITTEDQRDSVSSRGFALGYLGGGLLLAANLALLTLKPFGLSTEWTVRISLLSAGLWWGGFAIITFLNLKVREAMRTLPPGKSLLTVGFSELRDSFRELRRLPHTMRYLVGYLFYNDGIQTVIGLASVFLTQELFIAKGRSEDDAQSFVILVFLMVQFVAFVGALGFGRLAIWIGAKRAIMASLVLWTAVIVYAYGFLQTTAQAWGMAAMIAIVLGGSQALSRSLFSRMIPAGREAAFFGVYEITERGTSWIGPLIFGYVVSRTDSYRDAILSLIVLFALGLLILALTDTDRAIHDSGNETPAEAATHAPHP
ncbi:MAG: MFS transporter [Thermomicrobiales bacterium]